MGTARLLAGQEVLACASDAHHPALERSRFAAHSNSSAQRVRMLKAALLYARFCDLIWVGAYAHENPKLPRHSVR